MWTGRRWPRLSRSINSIHWRGHDTKSSDIHRLLGHPAEEEESCPEEVSQAAASYDAPPLLRVHGRQWSVRTSFARVRSADTFFRWRSLERHRCTETCLLRSMAGT